jgi:hypothetical protein
MQDVWKLDIGRFGNRDFGSEGWFMHRKVVYNVPTTSRSIQPLLLVPCHRHIFSTLKSRSVGLDAFR